VKPTYLRDAGHEVLNPSLDDGDFDAAVRTAQDEYDQHQPDVIVGSSRGGAVAMNINAGKTPLVLLCPAWKNWGTAKTVKPNTVILHSRSDEVIPFSDSEALVAQSGVPSETLIEVGNDHRLADPEPLKSMLSACEHSAVLIIGIDPASSKGLMVWMNETPLKKKATDARDWLSSLRQEHRNLLTCWDSPLSFNPAFSLSDRPVEKVLRAQVERWVKEGRSDRKRPHWQSCFRPAFLGMFSLGDLM
jgi:hypothetical protein